MANWRLGRNRHKPVSSNHVHASSKVRVPCPFWRIRSARATSNCSDVKEEPLFQARVTAPGFDASFRLACPKVAWPPFEGGATKLYGYRDSVSLGRLVPSFPAPLGGGKPPFRHVLDTLEGPLDLFPRIQQSDWTSMGAACRVLRFRKFQQ